ncbi:MAG: mechanosensitive ion channel, partial [Clostridia bacterium]
MEVLKKMWASIVDFFVNPNTYWNIVAVLLFLILGYIAMRVIKSLFIKSLEHNKHVDRTLRGFLVSLFSFGLYVAYFIILAGLLKIDTGSIIAILGSVGLALSLALQDSLGSIANGIIILFNKPFKEGDWIAVDGVEGTVKGIYILTTVLTSTDNKKIILPNSHITKQTVVNYSAEKTRKVIHEVNVAYNTDIDKLESIAKELMQSDDKILQEPSYIFKMNGFGANSLRFMLTYWVNCEDYWATYWGMNRKM